MRCSKCGRDMPDDLKYCGGCGAELRPPEEAFCVYCGKPLTKGADFCAYCGRSRSGKAKLPKKSLLLAALFLLLVGVTAVLVIALGFVSKDKDDKEPSGNESSELQVYDALDTPAAQTAAPSSTPSVLPIDIQGKEEASLQITQIDTSAYPSVRLFFRLSDKDGEFINELSNPVLNIIEDSGSPIETTPHPVRSGEKNVAFVMDISSSMQNDFQYSQNAVLSMLDQMKAAGGYSASLIAFNDAQNLLEDFTTDFSNIRSELSQTVPGGGAAFWDTLELALLRSNDREGQKCVIAVAGGADSCSRTSGDYVSNLSRQLQIPVYIITLDSSLYGQFQTMTSQTGGECILINSPQELSGAYSKIFDRQQAQYTAEFTSDGRTGSQDRQLNLSLSSSRYYAQQTSRYHKVDDLYTEYVDNSIITDVTASSHLEEYYTNLGYLYHGPENVIDGSYRTAWVENVRGNGTGEWIQLGFDQSHALHGIDIANGYKKTYDLYNKNSRLARVRVSFSDGSFRDFDLEDLFAGEQRLTFDAPVMTNSVRLEILEVYPGYKYQDTCITEIRVF